MKKKRIIAMVLIGIMIVNMFSLTSCGTEETTNKTGEITESTSKDHKYTDPITFKIGGGPSSSTNYVVAAGFASLLNSEYSNYNVTGEITIGTQENIRMIQSGDYLMSLAMMDSVVAAYEGTREYEPEEAEKFNLVICGNATLLHLMARADDDSIQSFADIKGKNVGVSSGVMSQYYFPMLLKAYGLTENDMKITTLALQDMCGGLADGAFDAIFHVVGIGSAPIADVAVTTGIKLLPIDTETAEKIRETDPYWNIDEFPSGSYNGIDSSVQTLSTTIALIASIDCPDEVVYDTVKLILENPDKVKAIHAIAGNYNKDNALKSVLIPIHPGAEKYYEEIGML